MALNRWLQAQYEDALASYAQSLAIDPNEGIFYNQGLALTNLEQYDEAIASFEQAIALNPENADAREQVERLKPLKAQAKLAV
ncbi:MAG: tetratricopeptide repeat protein [Phormidesmis sp.]